MSQNRFKRGQPSFWDSYRRVQHVIECAGDRRGQRKTATRRSGGTWLLGDGGPGRQLLLKLFVRKPLRYGPFCVSPGRLRRGSRRGRCCWLGRLGRRGNALRGHLEGSGGTLWGVGFLAGRRAEKGPEDRQDGEEAQRSHQTSPPAGRLRLLRLASRMAPVSLSPPSSLSSFAASWDGH